MMREQKWDILFVMQPLLIDRQKYNQSMFSFYLFFLNLNRRFEYNIFNKKLKLAEYFLFIYLRCKISVTCISYFHLLGICIHDFYWQQICQITCEIRPSQV